MSLPDGDGLADLERLVASGQVTPVLDRTYPLPDGVEAIGHVGEGHARGKTVIAVGDR